MATATTNGTTTRPLKTFKLTCPFCGENEPINMDLNDLTQITCSSCDDTFTPETAVKRVTEQLRRWQAVCRWVAMATEAMDSADPM